MSEHTEADDRELLATSVVIAQDVPSIPGVLAAGTVTVAELHFGVLVARTAEVRAERLRRLSILQRRLYALPLDEVVAATAHAHDVAR